MRRDDERDYETSVLHAHGELFDGGCNSDVDDNDGVESLPNDDHANEMS